jgi:hypothetical protein
MRSPFVVIPAKAGIQFGDKAFPMAYRVDSRLRGNDRRFDRGRIPNDITTPFWVFTLD